MFAFCWTVVSILIPFENDKNKGKEQELFTNKVFNKSHAQAGCSDMLAWEKHRSICL